MTKKQERTLCSLLPMNHAKHLNTSVVVSIVVVVVIAVVVVGEREHELRDITFFLAGEAQIHAAVVVVHHGVQRGKAPVMVEATLGVGPQSVQRSGPIAIIGRAACLEII